MPAALRASLGRFTARVPVTLVLLLAACAPAAAPPAAVVPATAPPAAAAPAPTASAAAQPSASPSAASVPAASPAARSGARDVVKYAQFASISQSALYLAVARGYFDEQGIQAEPVAVQSGADLIAPMTRGDIDVGTASPSAGLFNAAARGIPIKVVADWTDVGPGRDYQAIVVRKDLFDAGTLKTPADLKGKKIALPGKGTISEVVTATLLERAGLRLDDVELAFMPFPQAVAALAGKSVDAAFLVEPLVTQVQDQGTAVRWLGMHDVLPNTNIAVLTYAPSILGRPEVARRFMTAVLKGVRDYSDAFTTGRDRQAVFAIIGREANVSPELLGRIQPTAVDLNLRVPRASLEFDQQWFARNGQLSGQADLAQIIDEQFAQYAVAQLGAR